MYAQKLFESLHSNEAGSKIGSPPATMSRPTPSATTTISGSNGTSSIRSSTHSAQLSASSQLLVPARCDLISRIYKPQSATPTTNFTACNSLNSGEEFAEELSKYMMKQVVADLCENPLEW